MGELKACPPNFFIPPKQGPWDCIEVTAPADNQGKRVPTAASIFGQIYDADGYACLAASLDPTQKSPLADIEGKIPKGKSQVSFVVAVQSRSPRPLSFAGFKASYRNAGIERTYKTFDPC